MPLAEHDQALGIYPVPYVVSIHVPLAEHDIQAAGASSSHWCFNSRAPRGARHSAGYIVFTPRSFNSRAPRGARLQGEGFLTGFSVSIHVPLAEHDSSLLIDKFLVYVSIHVPLAEHDPAWERIAAVKKSFNSRAPRGARPSYNVVQVQAHEFQFTCPSRSTTPSRHRVLRS